MTVTRGHDGNPRSEIEKDVTVHILHHRAASALSHQRIAARVRGRNILLIELKDTTGVWPRQRSHKMRQFRFDHERHSAARANDSISLTTFSPGRRPERRGAEGRQISNRSLTLPVNPAIAGVLQENTTFSKLLADAVGGGKISRLPGGPALGHEAFDFGVC